MVGVLVEEEQVPLPEHDLLLSVDDVGRAALAHVHDLDVVVLVAREPGEAGVGAHPDQLPVRQHPAALDREAVATGVELPVDARAVEDLLFLRRDLAQQPQQLRVHPTPSFPRQPSSPASRPGYSVGHMPVSFLKMREK